MTPTKNAIARNSGLNWLVNKSAIAAALAHGAPWALTVPDAHTEIPEIDIRTVDALDTHRRTRLAHAACDKVDSPTPDLST